MYFIDVHVEHPWGLVSDDGEVCCRAGAGFATLTGLTGMPVLRTFVPKINLTLYVVVPHHTYISQDEAGAPSSRNRGRSCSYCRKFADRAAAEAIAVRDDPDRPDDWHSLM